MYFYVVSDTVTYVHVLVLWRQLKWKGNGILYLLDAYFDLYMFFNKPERLQLVGRSSCVSDELSCFHILQ